jgi:hypothetical protein
VIIIKEQSFFWHGISARLALVSPRYGEKPAPLKVYLSNLHHPAFNQTRRSIRNRRGFFPICHRLAPTAGLWLLCIR